jgi:CRISPR-associated protein Csb3
VTEPEPTIRVAVDPTNPGQFFACCGLLELADRLWPGAEGWFAHGDREFCIACGGTLVALLDALTNADINSSLTDHELKRLGTLLSANKSTLSSADAEEKARLSALWKAERLHLSKPFDLWIDWWFDEKTGGKAMKTWAAKQLVLDMARPMNRAMRSPKWREGVADDALTRPANVDAVPFYFDAHANWQSTPRDVGFGLYTLRNDIKTDGNTRPLLELAAFFGIQRFRPATKPGKKLLIYTTWPIPLPVVAASVAANGLLGMSGEGRYAFRMLFRSEYMKAFLPAQPYHGD